MSSLNTNTLNNTLKAQQLSGKKALQDTAQTAGNTGFENLFATALSQRANPQAKLSMINEELQEALGGSTHRSSEGSKKPFNASESNNPNSDANPYGMSSNTLAQANMWAQRDWAQSNRVESTAVSSTQQASSRPVESGVKPSDNSVKASSTEGQTNTQAAIVSKSGEASNTEAANKTESQPQSNSAQGKPAEASGSTANADGAPAQATNANANAESTTQTGRGVQSTDNKSAGINSNAAMLPGTEQNPALDGALNGSTGSPSDAASGTAATSFDATANAAQAADPSTLGQACPLSASTDSKADASQTALQGFEGKLDASPTSTKTDGLRPQLEVTGTNSPANLSNQASRPDMAQTAAALQAQQSGNAKSGANARSLKAGDEILATGATGATGASGSTASNQAAGIGLAGMATGRTGSAAEATIKTPVNQPGFVKELGAQVQWAVGKNLSTVDIRLSAGQMGGDAGSMNMRIIQRGQDIQLVIRTQDEATASMLNQTIAGLKETMAQNGLQLTQVQIQTGNNPNAAGNSSLANAQQQAQQQAGQSGNNAGGQSGRQGNDQGNTNGDGQVEAVEPQRRNRSNGNIDLVA
ncbi:MAG: flagellar hook-length control protein FliK [Limnobacter sp.]|nr:flagellar hook-length control protein FliK [Limnobacter sp.]